VQDLADAIERTIHPRGLGVIMRAQHFCCVWRGVRDAPTQMVTSITHGLLREGRTAHSEFLALIRATGF